MFLLLFQDNKKATVRWYISTPESLPNREVILGVEISSTVVPSDRPTTENQASKLPAVDAPAEKPDENLRDAPADDEEKEPVEEAEDVSALAAIPDPPVSPTPSAVPDHSDGEAAATRYIVDSRVILKDHIIPGLTIETRISAGAFGTVYRVSQDF